MCPVLLLFLLMAALNSESSANLPEDNTGRKFIAAFPENIAYYHPVLPQNKIQITALHDNTVIIIKQHTYEVITDTLMAGQSKEFTPNVGMEIWKQQISNLVLYITSTNNITVHAISLRDNSMQTALVIPADKLSNEYLIPQIPTIKGTTDQVSVEVTERNPFRLIIISGNKATTGTVEGAQGVPFKLEALQIWQILLNKEHELKAVKADQPVAVFFFHPCAIQFNCTCGLLHNMLPPAKEETLKFLVPPVLAGDADGETFLLLPDKIKPLDPTSPLVEAAGMALLYRPGLLLPLIPETDFGSCFVVGLIPDTQSFAVIVVHKDFTDGVRVGNLPLESPEWKELTGTEYVSTDVELLQVKVVIWHTSSTMAVYFKGSKGDAVFGNPGAMLSKTPDFRGCVLAPEVLKIGEVANGWRESLRYCRGENLDLVSMPSAQLGAQISRKVFEAKDDSLQEVWIGMRRSSQTGAWYWLNKAPVNDTNWKEGEPGMVDDGQCAIMSLESEDFEWSDEDCCKVARPVCYSDPILLPL